VKAHLQKRNLRLDKSLAGNRRALRDAMILAAIVAAAWFLVAETETCTRLFSYVAAHPDTELDSIILAGMFSTFGLLVFSVRRWREAARAERTARELALTDALTGLPNRRAFMELLQDATAPAGGHCACLLFDLDNFKQVNDLRGHLAGDELLRAVATRLREYEARDVATARIGGDEFAMLVRFGHPKRAQDLARSVARRLSEPLVIDGSEVHPSVSAGIAHFPGDAGDASTLIRMADIALYRAKAGGRATIQSFTRDMEEADRRRMAVSEALREALQRNELVPYYQPLVDLATGGVVAYEVLGRWTSPTLGPVEPREFIPIARECGLINSLSFKLLERACADAVAWPHPSRISFNIAPPQLADPLLPLQIMAAVVRSGLSPRRLELEITEDALLENVQTVAANVAALKSQGITIALDDFGSGYSSLHHLRTLPFDKVKIDRSYVAHLGTCSDAKRMVEAIVQFVHALGIPLVAEGVETVEQARILEALGCDLAQGWLYGKPAPNAQLKTGRRAALVCLKSSGV
jgi:diguanylate cyclase (GGDEF)-like protein